MKQVALIIDMQERLILAMSGKDEIIRHYEIFLNAMKILEIPVIFTRQYPKGLGDSVSSQIAPACSFDKMSFSCMQVDEIADELNKYDEVLLCGIEAHICVLQSVNELLNAGKSVKVIADCIGARDEKNVAIALDLMKENGAKIHCTESVIFEILRSANHPKFKEIAKIIK